MAPPRNLLLGELIGTSFGAVRGPIRPFLKIGPTCVRRVKPLGIEPGLGRRETRPWAPRNGSRLFPPEKRHGKNVDSNHAGFACQKSFKILESPDRKTLGFRTRWPPAVFSPEKQQPSKFGHAGLVKICHFLVNFLPKMSKNVPGPHFSW